MAARRGMTLTALVSEAVGRFVDPVPENNGELPQRLKPEMDWYEANRKMLMDRYEGEYIAIVNQKVIDHHRDFGSLASRVFRRVGRRPVFLPKCVRGGRKVVVASPHRQS